MVRDNLVYNYCEEVEHYCEASHQVVRGSLISKFAIGCFEYVQDNIALIDQANISKGLKVEYKLKNQALANATVSATITQVY